MAAGLGQQKLQLKRGGWGLSQDCTLRSEAPLPETTCWQRLVWEGNEGRGKVPPELKDNLTLSKWCPPQLMLSHESTGSPQKVKLVFSLTCQKL